MSAPAFPPPSRKSIFDTVRRILRRGFSQTEVDEIDEALDSVPDTGLEIRADSIDDFTKLDGVNSASRTGSPERVSVPLIRKVRGTPNRIGAEGVALIKRFEGCARLRRDGMVEAYPDPGTGGAPWTIGWGATRNGLYGFVERETVWSQAQCDERLIDDLKHYANDVVRAIGDAPTTQAQFDAMVSFHYNTGAIHRATLTKKHKAGDFAGAASEFARWNKAGGRVLKGLVRRRAAETELYRV